MTTTMPTISPPEKLSAEEIAALEKPFRRLDLLLYTVAEVARIVDQPYHRIYRWTYPANSQEGANQTAGHPMPPIIASGPPEEFGWPTIPFVGLAQAQVATFLFQGGATSRHIRQLQAGFRNKLGCEYPLAHKAFHACATEFADFGSSQPAFNKFRQGITYGDNGYPTRFQLTKYKIANVMVDPAFSSGQPVYKISAVGIDDILGRLHAGETLAKAADDFNTPMHEIQDTWNYDRHATLY